MLRQQAMQAAFAVQTVCECQTLLGAELDEACQVLEGWAGPPTRREPAPANSVCAARKADHLDLVWHCPVCGRNTLRAFHSGALIRLAT